MKLYPLIISALFTLFSAAAMAQSETGTETEQEIPRYDVEIVVFKNLRAPKSREFILPVSSPSKGKNVLDLSSAASVEAARELDFEILSGDEYRLLDVAVKLIQSNRYQLLAHVAWRQPGQEREQALPVWIRGGRIYGNEYTSIDNQIEFLEGLPETDNEDPAADQSFEFDEQTLESLELQLLEQQTLQAHQGLYELEGKITITLTRYLHVFTDLVLRRPRLSADTLPNNPAQDKYLAAYAADTRILNNHSLREHRRMRSKTLHYLDNPEFSLLVLITPYEAPEEIVEEAAETAPEPETTSSE